MTSPPRRLRIAVLNRIFSPNAGGAERYSFALVRELSARHEIHVFAQEVEHAGGMPIPGVTYHLVSRPITKPRWFNQLWFATATWRATRRSSNLAFDLVHSHENTWHGDVQTVHVLPVKHNLFSGRAGLKKALRWFKILTSPRLLVYLLLERLRYQPQPGRAVVVTSETLLITLSNTYPEAEFMTSVVTPGIDLPLESSPAQKILARQRLGVPTDGHCLLFVGNDMRKKGLQTVIEALATLAAGGDLARAPTLAVAGASDQTPQFKEQAERAGLSSRVFFLGALKDMDDAYTAADCLVHPTLEDTFGMVVLEAMAHGLPVVVSNARYCGVAGLLENEVNALILEEPRDSAVLAKKLQRVLLDCDLANRLGGAARELAADHQWSDVAARQEAVYLRLINLPSV